MVRSIRAICFTLLLSLLSSGSWGATLAGQSKTHFQLDVKQRLRTSINEGWKYIGEDPKGAEALTFNDSQWTTVNLPHTWNALDTQDDEPGYRRGSSWYRKTLRLPEALKGKRLFLYFEGANQVAEVFVNGQLAGRHAGGYTAFDFDITALVQFDSSNLIAVRVDNSHNRDIPPLSADFNFYGGIYRNVWLIATAPVHITLLDHASQGVRVDTPEVSEASATVRVRAEVINNESQPRQVRVVSTIVDTGGEKVAAMESARALSAGQEAEFELLSRPLARPQLWSPDHPYLYTVYTQVYVDERAVDSVESPLGLRWYHVDADRGFFLNGKPLKLRGANRHQDYQGLGNAVPDALQVRDMQIIKEMGANFVRLAHYPQAPVVLDTADRLGLIIWEEIPIVNYITTSEAFTQTCENMLVEMIRQHYNHPSVFVWGYMNEILLKPQKEEGYTGKVVDLARRLNRVAHREDPTRLTVMAMHHSELYNTSGLADVPDAVGWNLYFGWYEGVFSDFGPFLDDQHKRYPKRPIFISEYGADADRRIHSLKPERFDYTIEWQRLLHENYLGQIEERPFLAGTTFWNEFDFGSEERGESKPHMNQKGLLTFDRQPKDIYFFYQARLSGKPVLRLATHDWLIRTGTSPLGTEAGSGPPGALQPVEVFTNLPQVELTVNGRSLGSQAVGPSCHATWQVPLRDGLNTLEAQGSSGGEILRDSAEVRFIYYAPILKDRAVPFRDLAVNVGSNAQYLDASGTVWEADRPYTPGGWGYTGGRVVKTPRNIPGTDDDYLYQHSREGLKSYRFDLPDGNYQVELLFAEPEFTEPRKRVFGVKINGQPVIKELDLVKEYGTGRAARRTFQIQAVKGEGIRIDFESIAGRPLLSAIRVHRY